MTPEQAQMLRMARDTMPKELIQGLLYRGVRRRGYVIGDRVPRGSGEGVCGVGHLCGFADVPLDWINGLAMPDDRTSDVLFDAYGLPRRSLDRIATANDGSDAHQRSAYVRLVIDAILLDFGQRPYPETEESA